MTFEHVRHRARPPGALTRVLAVAVAALVAACGSTVAGQATSVNSGGGGTTDGLSGTPGAAAAATNADGGPITLSGPGGRTTSSGAAASIASGGVTQASQSGAGTATVGSDGRRVLLGKGVTATTVKIGMAYSPDVNDAQRATGQSNLQTGDARAQEQALIDEINRTGGLGGRRIVLDAYAISATTPDVEQAFNAACQHFVDDAKDFAVITAGPESFGACLEKGGVLQIGSDLTSATAATTRLQPHGLRPAGITMDDAARLLVEGLNEQGYFKNSVIGVITFDAPPYKRTIDGVMLPALKRIGHPAKDTFFVQTPNSVSDYGAMSSSIGSAVLKFRSDGITHVVIFDQQGRITSFFTPQAESQQYRPRYGFTSQAGFQVGLTGGGVPPAQAKDAAGIGWLPAFDVPVDMKKLSAGAKRCSDFFGSKGMPANGANAMVIQQFQCQDAWLLDTVMDQLTSNVTRDAFVGLVDAGSPLETAANIGIGFDRLHHDGVEVVRNVGWNGECGCFRYVGGDRRLR
jgi:hypothetical protein